MVCKVDASRGFGFLRPLQGGEDAFFALKEIPEGGASISLGSELEYQVKLTERGPRASELTVVRATPKSPYKRFYVWAFLVTVIFATGVHLWFEVPLLVAYLVAITFAAFVLCGYDKSVAESGATRVPEMVLFMVALLGGTGGLLFGMNLFRHKTQKESFQFVLGVVLIGQLLALRYLWQSIRELGLV